jgi:hypothetical protein
MYRDRIRRYQEAAENSFNNFSGYTPRNYMNAVDDAGVAGAEVLDPNDRTLTITVVNASVSAITGVRIFGAVKDLTDATKNAAVTISVAESSHLQVKTELLQNPFRILGLKYTVTTAAQFNYPLTLVEEKSTGGLISRLWQPLNYRSAQNTLTTQIDAPTFEFLVSANCYFTFTLAASETVTFTFTIVEKIDAKNALRNGMTRSISRTQAPTGLPQIDMKRGL